jgi:hypothetical protein
MDVAEPRPRKQRPLTGITGPVDRCATDLSSIIRPIKFCTLSPGEAADALLARDDAKTPFCSSLPKAAFGLRATEQLESDSRREAPCLRGMALKG